MRFAVIGCGRVAGNHLRAIAALENAELVAVCDIVEERAKAYAAEFWLRAHGIEPAAS